MPSLTVYLSLCRFQAGWPWPTGPTTSPTRRGSTTTAPSSPTTSTRPMTSAATAPRPDAGSGGDGGHGGACGVGTAQLTTDFSWVLRRRWCWTCGPTGVCWPPDWWWSGGRRRADRAAWRDCGVTVWCRADCEAGPTPWWPSPPARDWYVLYLLSAPTEGTTTCCNNPYLSLFLYSISLALNIKYCRNHIEYCIKIRSKEDKNTVVVK